MRREWANWGTILRIEVTAESPAVGCGNGNQCVVIDVNSDSADTSIKLQAYRINSQENKFVAALMLVELSENATDSDTPAYAHSDGSVARLKVDEEDEVKIKFGNLRGSIDVENEDPEISNFGSGSRSRIRRCRRGLHLHGNGQQFRYAGA